MGAILDLKTWNTIAPYILVTRWILASDPDPVPLMVFSTSDDDDDPPPVEEPDPPVDPPDNPTESNPIIVEPYEVEAISEDRSILHYDLGDGYAKIDFSGISESSYSLSHFGPNGGTLYRSAEAGAKYEYIKSLNFDSITFQNLNLIELLQFVATPVHKSTMHVKSPIYHESMSALVLNGLHRQSKIVCDSNPNALNAHGQSSIAIGYSAPSPGLYSAAFGNNVLAFGAESMSTGMDTKAIGVASHAEGRETIAQGSWSHAEGGVSTAYGKGSHAEGNLCVAINDYSHAEGVSCTAKNTCAHAEGWGTIAASIGSHAQGYKTQAASNYAFSSGGFTTASGTYAQGLGYYANANGVYSIALGRINSSFPTGASSSNTVGDVLRVGNGVISGTTLQRSTAFRVAYSGDAYVAGEMNTGGADYAEFFEWQDGNPDAEDRVGHFVTLDGEFIRYASKGDYILGIVSGNPAVVGNSDEDYKHRWLKDDFGRLVREYLEPSEELIDTSEASEDALEELRNDPEVEEREGEFYRKTEVPTDHVTSSWRHKQSPDYNPDQPYTERKDRPEWDYVGMLGVLAVYDDGTCEVNSYCQCGENGIATKASMAVAGQSFRVIKRIAPNIVKVVFR